MPPPPPPLVDDLISEILLRLPPDDPACLVRASLVCKPWRRLLTDRGFLGRYRAFHRTPPVLGFLHKDYRIGGGGFFPRFVPTTQAWPLRQAAPNGRVLDCRNGRVLLQVCSYSSYLSRFTVWDPITGDQQQVPPPVHPDDSFTAAVLCASDGCDHLDCHGGPFLVVFAVAGITIEDDDDDGDDDGDGATVTWVSVYSSETGTWSASVSIDLDSFIDVWPSLLARDALYFFLGEGERILKYDITGGVLSVISSPPLPDLNFVLSTADDGGLGVATVEGYSLHLWSCRTGPDGDMEWAQGRVIELDTMISIAIGDPSTKLDVVGFAEGSGSIFISANDGIFTVELKSGRIRKIGKRGDFYSVFPFTSFYTPDHASARLNAKMRIE